MNVSTHIHALVKLMDDPDDHVYEHVRQEIKKCGADAIPILEHSWEHDYYGMVFQNRIEDLIHEIQFSEIQRQLLEWSSSPDKDLLEGAILIAKYQYPGLDELKIKESIQNLRKDIWLELNDNQTSFEKVKIFNRIFFDLYQFSGDTKHYHSPVNSFINTVLESKKGNPLSLCLLYSIVAQSLDLPIYGVNLPNHFVLAYMDEYHANHFGQVQNDFGVLFYINTFSKGIIFDVKEIEQFLNDLNIEHKREYFEPCSNTAIIKRMLTNLIFAFQQIGNSEKVEELTLLKSLLD
ncbi:MAG: transglutaminase-like domain-containing protein [Crocinitomicaceae bacterium]